MMPLITHLLMIILITQIYDFYYNHSNDSQTIEIYSLLLYVIIHIKINFLLDITIVSYMFIDQLMMIAVCLFRVKRNIFHINWFRTAYLNHLKLIINDFIHHKMLIDFYLFI